MNKNNIEELPKRKTETCLQNCKHGNFIGIADVWNVKFPRIVVYLRVPTQLRGRIYDAETGTHITFVLLGD